MGCSDCNVREEVHEVTGVGKTRAGAEAAGWVSVRAMDSWKACFLWALGVGGVGLVVGLCVSAGLVLALRSALAFPGWLWVVTRCLVVMQGVCLVAGVVLLVRGPDFEG